MARDAGAPDAAWSGDVASLHGLRLGRCARRILLLAPRPSEEAAVIPAERAGRAAGESHRRAMRRLAELGLLELTWKTETIETKRQTRTASVRWDPEAGVHREAEPKPIPIARAIDRRASKLTGLGAFVVDRLRPELETGKRIRWATISKVVSE